MGLIIIPYAAYLVYVKETFCAWDFLLMSFAAMVLIWFKEDAARELIDKVLNKDIQKP